MTAVRERLSVSNGPTSETCLPGGQPTCLDSGGSFLEVNQGDPEPIPVAEVVSVNESFTDALWESLDAIEAVPKRMIEGIGRCVFSRLPRWMARFMVDLSQFGAKAASILFLFSIWIALSLLPLALLVLDSDWLSKSPLTALFVITWTSVAVGSSIWGLLYTRGSWHWPRWPWRSKNRKAASTTIEDATR